MTQGHRLKNNHGHVLLAALMVVIMLVLLSMALLHITGQEAPGISAMREQTQALHLAEGAADLVISWFHEPSAVPDALAGVLTKRQDAGDGPSFFDATGRSQFTGTPEHPDVLLDASNDSDARLLNGSPSGFTGGLPEPRRVGRLKIYAPTQPGMLGTVEVTASTGGARPLPATIRLQLGALNIPAIRAAVQIGHGSGTLAPGAATMVLPHWGDIRVMGDMVVNHDHDLVLKSANAPVTGQSYEALKLFEDRWVDYWIGASVSVLAPSATGTALPANVHTQQRSTSGLRLDLWDYERLKRTAQRHGTYYRLGRDGRLHDAGAHESDPGIVPAEALTAPAVGQSRGLVFVDTVDGEAPTPENFGTLVLDTDYVEALVIVQGHVVVKPSGAGRTLTVLSPPPEGSSSLSGRIPVMLSGIHLNGLLYAAGTISIERQTRLYGAVVAAGTLVTAGAVPLEVWYNWDFGRGLFRGLPVVYRAPATWQVKY